MNNQLVAKVLITSALLSNLLMGSDIDNNSESEMRGGPDFFASFLVGGGSGSVKIATENGDEYTFIDGKDSVSTSDMKVLAGYDKIYLFYQAGNINPETQYLDELKYSTMGIGFLSKMQDWKVPMGLVAIVPEFDVELGYDKVVGEGALLDGVNSVGDFEASGLFIGIDAILGLTLTDLPYVTLLAGVGFDAHVVNNSDSVSKGGSWNFTSLNVNAGARISF